MRALRRTFISVLVSVFLMTTQVTVMSKSTQRPAKANLEKSVQQVKWVDQKKVIKPAHHQRQKSNSIQLGKTILRTTAAVNTADSLALVALYNSTNGDSWDFNTNWLVPSKKISTWFGVHVSGTRVDAIDLSYNNLTGTLPTAIGDLTALELLDLYSNSITGSLPTQLGNLSAMEYLDLGDNLFEGSIPTSLGSLGNLVYLYLDYNLLEGSIPTQFSGLSSIEDLCLCENSLTGSIPAQLGGLTTLIYLDLYDNLLTGSIPTELGSLSNLIYFDLSFNSLSGTIPSALGSLGDVEMMDLGSNLLTGSIPSTLGSLSWASVLGLQDNLLTGSIPSELGNLAYLEALNLSECSLTGTIPSSFSGLTSIDFMLLNSNALTGPIPSSITGLELSADCSDFTYNMLYTDNDAIRNYVNDKQYGGDWESTQTIAPTNTAAGSTTSSTVTVSWSAIAYTDDTGGYRVGYSTSSGGPYTYFGMTADKSATSLQVTGLSPATPYYFVVSTQTNAHDFNSNVLVSEASTEVTATTTDGSLSVELSSFSIESVSNGALIKWITESEVDNLGFIIERAVGADGNADWQTIATYQTNPALQGQGNTSQRTDYQFTDVTAQSGTTYQYRLSDVDTKGDVTILDVIEITVREMITPDETRLEPAFPNPFNPQTKISYQLAEQASVSLNVYNINGRLVSRLLTNTQQPPGSYSIHWLGKDDSGRQAASGTYILRMSAGEVVQSQKVLLMR